MIDSQFKLLFKGKRFQKKEKELMIKFLWMFYDSFESMYEDKDLLLEKFYEWKMCGGGRMS